jgi:hypothetical protein
MTDADTIANAEELWRLVHLVQDTIGKDGRPLLVDAKTGSSIPPLSKIRKLADEIDPENGKF